MTTEARPSAVELARRVREVSLGWALDGKLPDPSQVAALGRPQLAQRLLRSRHDVDVSRAAYAATVPQVSAEMYRLWEARWQEAAAEARGFLMEVAGQ
jgi:post-segregation antitoxin (ccd killing protein)